MKTYDIAVIGAGIHGAGVAQAAAARGYSVLLLEKTAIAAGTSSRSSKLIHGGLRYLETAQFKLVRECLQERQILLNIAPGLVQLKPFYIPVYPTTKRSLWQLQTGLALYQALGGGSFKKIPLKQWPNTDGLNNNQLISILQYWDAQTDDAALTQAVMASALKLGAECVIPAQVTAIHLQTDLQTLNYQTAHQTHTINAKVIINAAGPWINQVLACVQPAQPQRALAWVQGTHLLLQNTTIQHHYYVEAPQDQRAVFILPYQDQQVLLGTTETPYAGDLEAITPLAMEESYLKTIFHYYFPQQPLQIRQAFAGIRVLPGGTGHAFFKPRDTKLIVDQPQKPRLLTIEGGKLTAYRITAQRVMQKIAPALRAPRYPGDTKRISLG